MNIDRQKIIGYRLIQQIEFDIWDSRCYGAFKRVLEAKAKIKKGLKPTGGFNLVITAINYIDNCSTNLKYYIGYLKAKRLILTAHKKFQERQ